MLEVEESDPSVFGCHDHTGPDAEFVVEDEADQDPSPEIQQKIDAAERYVRAKGVLQSLHIKLDNQPAFYEMGLAMYTEAVAEG